jgi:hypothetical protein
MIEIYVFVDFLSQWRKKEGGQDFRFLEVQEASSSHLKSHSKLEKTRKIKKAYFS